MVLGRYVIKHIGIGLNHGDKNPIHLTICFVVPYNTKQNCNDSICSPVLYVQLSIVLDLLFL